MKERMYAMEPRRLEIVISSQLDDQSVHNVLRRSLRLSGTLLRRIKWLEDGILLDGVRVHTRVTVQTGQVLSVRLSDPEHVSEIPPEPLPLDIVYEDRDIVVVNKAAGMTSHPGPGHWHDTLGNALLYHWQEHDPYADFHPVHRLDKGTSGLMVAAKHPFAQEYLRLALHSGDFQRTYLAVCDALPRPAAGVIDAPIGRSETSILERMVRPDGQRAVTRYETLSTDGVRSLVRLQLDTGRTHQIRVHMAYLGCPLTGDFLYGREDHGLIKRPALHSAALSLHHPVSGETLDFQQPLPPDMAALCRNFTPLSLSPS